MPVVRYVARKVATDPLVGARKSAAETPLSTGAGLAEAQGQTADALGRLAGTVGQIATQQVEAERARADQVALFEAETELGKWENRRLWDPKTGAMTVKGKDAMPLPEVVSGEFDSVASALEQNLSPRQRAAFQRVKANRAQHLDANLRRHVYGEVQRYEAQTLDATEENASESAAMNAVDHRRVGEELTRGVEAIKASGPRLGLTGPVLEKRLNDFTTRTYVGVIDKLVAEGKTTQARVYFEEAKAAGQITGAAALAHLTTALKVGTVRAEAQTLTAAILAEGGTLTEQREKATRSKDPEVVDQVRQRLEHEAAVKDKADRERDEATLTNAYTIVDRAHDVTAIPVATWAALPGPARAALRGYALSLAKGVPIETDQTTYYMLKEAATTHPADFLTTNLLTFKNKLSDTDFQELTGLRGAIRNGNTAAANKVLDDFRSASAVVSDALTLAGLDASPKDSDTEGKKRLAQFHGLVAAEVRRVQGDTGKKLDNAGLEALTNRLLAIQIGDKQGGWFAGFGLAVKGGTVGSRSLETATVADIPPAEKQAILARLAAKGRPATPEAALAIWLKDVARRGGP